MRLRWSLRVLLLACVTLAGLVASRTASAAAPFCDERGLSGIAPPPVMIPADVRLEAAIPGPPGLPCLESREAVADVDSVRGAPDAPVFSVDDGSIDAWVSALAVPPAPPATVSTIAPAIDDATRPLVGHTDGILRPPRPTD